MSSTPRPRGIAHLRSLVHGFSEGVAVGKLRTQHLTSPHAGTAPGPQLLREALEELRTHQEELTVADEEMHVQLEELAGAHARVHGERDRYRELFDLAPDAYFVTDRVGTIRDVNAEGANMLCIEPRFLVGKPLAAMVDAADTRTLRDALTTLGTAPSVEVEIRFRPRASEPRWHAVKGVNVEQGTAILWIARDVQAYHDKAAALASTNDELGAHVSARTSELERANRDKGELLERERQLRKQLEDDHGAKDRFLAMLSQDLRAPLNVVLGWTQLLRREKLDESARDRGLATIERSAHAQLKLVEELLDISRFSRDRVQLERVPVELRELVRGAVLAAAAEASERGVELRTSLCADGILVPGDRGRLEQVLANLLSNALKFTPHGGAVTVSLDHDGIAARLEVADTGRGIPPELLPHVFAAFRQAPADATPYDIPGLGLYVVRQVVAMHGGRIAAESEGVGTGSRFVVWLPMGSTTEARGVKGDGAEPISIARPRSSELEGVRVLVLDDERDARELMATILRQRGADVTVAPDAEAALHAFASVPPDVFVSDVAMPGQNGLDLARRLRANPMVTTVMIAVSGFTAPDEVERALDAGFDFHLAKPLEPQELVDAVRHAALLRA